MSLSDRLMGKKNVNGKPHIEAVVPNFAAGKRVRIVGKSLRPHELRGQRALRRGGRLGADQRRRIRDRRVPDTARRGQSW